MQRRPLSLSLSLYLSFSLPLFYSFSFSFVSISLSLSLCLFLLFSLLLFPLSPSLSHFLCLFVHKVSGSHVHVLPASLSEHLSMDYFLNPLTQKYSTLTVVRALMPSLAALPPNVRHRQQTGLSLLARTYSKTWVFLERLQMHAHRSRCWKPLTSLVKNEKLTIVSSVT